MMHRAKFRVQAASAAIWFFKNYELSFSAQIQHTVPFLFVLTRQCLQSRCRLSGQSYVKKSWHTRILITAESVDLLQDKIVENIPKTLEMATDISYYFKSGFKGNHTNDRCKVNEITQPCHNKHENFTPRLGNLKQQIISETYWHLQSLWGNDEGRYRRKKNRLF